MPICAIIKTAFHFRFGNYGQRIESEVPGEVREGLADQRRGRRGRIGRASNDLRPLRLRAHYLRARHSRFLRLEFAQSLPFLLATVSISNRLYDSTLWC